MALTRDQKAAQLVEIKDKMQKAKSVIFAHYIGLNVTNISKLRAQLRVQNAEMKVCKKSLIRLAAKEINAPEVKEEMLTGPVACIFSNEDPTSGASIAFKFAKDHDQVKLIGGIFDGKLLTQQDAMTFATIPSRETLLAMFMMMCNTPLTQFASACSGPLSGFARAMAEIAKKKESEAPVAAAAAPVAEAPAPAAVAAPVETPAPAAAPAAEAAAPVTATEPPAAPAAEAPAAATPAA